MGLAGVSPNQVTAGGGDQTQGAVHNIWARGRSSQSWKHFYNGYISREREESIYNTSIEDHWGLYNALHESGACYDHVTLVPGVMPGLHPSRVCDIIVTTSLSTWREKSPPPPGYWARSW